MDRERAKVSSVTQKCLRASVVKAVCFLSGHRNMKIFFSGIGGSGVSAIAGFMAEKGHQTAGSDRLFDLYPEHHVCRKLKEKGIVIFPQDGSGIDGSTELAVFSTAVEKDNPDFMKADATRDNCQNAAAVSHRNSLGITALSLSQARAGNRRYRACWLS